MCWNLPCWWGTESASQAECLWWLNSSCQPRPGISDMDEVASTVRKRSHFPDHLLIGTPVDLLDQCYPDSWCCQRYLFPFGPRDWRLSVASLIVTQRFQCFSARHRHTALCTTDQISARHWEQLAHIHHSKRFYSALASSYDKLLIQSWRLEDSIPTLQVRNLSLGRMPFTRWRNLSTQERGTFTYDQKWVKIVYCNSALLSNTVLE